MGNLLDVVRRCRQRARSRNATRQLAGCASQFKRLAAADDASR
jgi:hypothetical protein